MQVTRLLVSSQPQPYGQKPAAEPVNTTTTATSNIITELLAIIAVHQSCCTITYQLLMFLLANNHKKAIKLSHHHHLPLTLFRYFSLGCFSITDDQMNFRANNGLLLYSVLSRPLSLVSLNPPACRVCCTVPTAQSLP